MPNIIPRITSGSNRNNRNSDGDKIRQPGLIRKLAGFIQRGTNDLYKNIYFNDPTDKQTLDKITADISNTVRDIINDTTDTTGQPNITKLYERLLANGVTNKDDKQLNAEFERIFGSNEFTSQLTASWMSNRWVKTIDMEIDQLLVYMPKLAEALSTLTDNVLSADSFNKDFLNLVNNLDSSEEDEQFARNISDLKDKYDLIKLTKDIYKQTSKYGECFVYRVPYTKSIQRFLDRKNASKAIGLGVSTNENGLIIESTLDGKTTIPLEEDKITTIIDTGGLNCEIIIEDGIISSIIETAKKINDTKNNLRQQSLFREAMNEAKIDRIDLDSSSKAYALDDTINRDPQELRGKLPRHRRFDRTISDTLQLPDLDDSSPDGLVNMNNSNGKIKDINGCIVKILKRERVVPIILQNVCLGYYYFEFDNTMEMFDERMSSTGLVNTLTGIRSNHRMEAFDSLQRREEMLKTIASELAKKIDVKFIDANQDLKKEIYYILKYNDEFNASLGQSNTIRVSYIPPEDIKHFYFELDEETGRGISDLNMSLIPAKLWVGITLCNCLGIMTRSNDRRVYYVRQSVESNINKTLLKTINEIKRANFNIRQIENINSVLNITGRFNDFIIPRSADGQSPLDIEIMQGQNIDIKTDLLTMLEEAAINPLVPYESVQSRQSPDFAMQLSMQNSKFLRFVYDRQANYEPQMSDLVTDIYNLEYGTHERINLKLPPPLFINVNNTNQLVQNTLDYCNNILEVSIPDEQDDTIKQKVKKELARKFLGSYLDMNMVDQLIDKAYQERTVDKIKNPEEDMNGNGMDNGMGGGYGNSEDMGATGGMGTGMSGDMNNIPEDQESSIGNIPELNQGTQPNNQESNDNGANPNINDQGIDDFTQGAAARENPDQTDENSQQTPSSQNRRS